MKKFLGIASCALVLTSCSSAYSAFPPPPSRADLSSQGARVANLLTGRILCSTVARPAEKLDYGDSDFFDCRLKKSLDASSSIVTVDITQEISSSLDSIETGDELVNELPDRLAAWAESVRKNGNEVTVCVENRGEPWQFLIGLGLSLIDRFLGSKTVDSRYKATEDFNLAVIYDAKGSTNSVKLERLEFWHKTQGSIASKTPFCKLESDKI